ncbi:uncharacterized protein [Gossypium hirsutum]|uniref:DUF4219 domain-containing protein n=1 Tax=Gossypium hirsutum TaxID=3635 RepID=A0A1U8PR89_GOSHI|nr:uncharacterized protein LOC107961039 [Gossypium hirsutum]
MKSAPHVFDGENYQAWAIRIQAYIEGYDYWEAADEEYDVTPLPDNPTMNQIKMHDERTTRKAKDYLKAQYQGDERIKSMKVLISIREFERLQMKESESIKEYSDKMIDISDKVRVLGTDFSDSRLVHKILVSMPKKYEATIASFDNTKDLTQFRVVELISGLQA